MKKGDLTTLQALIGLVVGIAFTVLIIFVTVKFIGIFIPNSEKEQSTPVSVFEEINKYKDNEVHFIDFTTISRGLVIGFNKDSNVLNLESLNLDVIDVRRPIEITGPRRPSGGGYTIIKKLSKPKVCQENTCICGCVIKKNSGSVEDFSAFCEEEVKCVILKDLDKVEYGTVSPRGENPNKIFFLFNPLDYFDSDLSKHKLILRKEGKTIFIK